MSPDMNLELRVVCSVTIAFAAGRRATGTLGFRLIAFDSSYSEKLLDCCLVVSVYILACK